MVVEEKKTSGVLQPRGLLQQPQLTIQEGSTRHSYSRRSVVYGFMAPQPLMMSRSGADSPPPPRVV